MTTPPPVLAVTPNPALDITYAIGDYEHHGVHRVQQVTRRAGGKGVNVASILAQRGFPVTTTGFLGGAQGEELQSLLPPTIQQAWVHSTIPTRATTVIFDNDGATLFNEPGPAQTEQKWDQLAETVGQLARSHPVVTISGSLPAGATAEHLAALIAAAHHAGAVCLVDTSGPNLVAAAAAGADVLKPNREELLDATGTDTPEAGAAVLLAAGAGAVVVSDGPQGLGLFRRLHPDNDTLTVIWARPSYTAQGNATGAGDTVVAALAHHLSLAANGGEVEWPAALAEAVALSGAAVMAPTAGVFDEASFAEFSDHVSVETKEYHGVE